MSWLVVLAVALAGADGDSPYAPRGDVLRTATVARVVRDAHHFLIEHQNDDGSFSVVRGVSAHSAPVAVTALAALSLMAGGNLPDRGLDERGLFDNRVKRAIDWLIDHCQADGKHVGYFAYGGDEVSKMHGQGYALLALTQAVGMYGDTDDQRLRLRLAIERAVHLIERTQGLQGGWWYEPERHADAHEGSLTVCMIQALRAAKDAGFAVDGGVIRKAEVYMQRSQDETTGRFRYSLSDTRTTWALTAAALSTLNALGDYGSGRLDAGYDALQRDDPYITVGGAATEMFQQYGAFYAAQAYWSHRDPRLFESWWPEFVDNCAEAQDPDGSFRNGQYGKVYATSIVSLTLQVPFGYLPLFQR